mmetsp:Transcript_34296/g.79285  ORF Transcript_34296/g.79285 Transcript_34296/m.79285 type:complete len:286 (-) Transcript_34296:775-1632(-)
MEVGDADFVVLIVKLVEEGVEAFGRVVDASGIGRMQDVRFASSRKDDIDVTLGDLSSGSSVAVDPHGSQVDDMSVDLRVDDGTAQVVVAGHVVFDSVPLLLGSLHGIRSGALFRKVHDRIGLFVLDELHKQVIILGHVQIDELHVLARHLLPRLHADLRRLDGSERVASQFVVDVAPGQVVHYHDIVAHVREVEGGGPSAEAVAAEDDHLLFLKLAIGWVGGKRGRREAVRGRERRSTQFFFTRYRMRTQMSKKEGDRRGSSPHSTSLSRWVHILTRQPPDQCDC